MRSPGESLSYLSHLSLHCLFFLSHPPFVFLSRLRFAFQRICVTHVWISEAKRENGWQEIDRQRSQKRRNRKWETEIVNRKGQKRGYKKMENRLKRQPGFICWLFWLCVLVACSSNSTLSCDCVSHRTLQLFSENKLL